MGLTFVSLKAFGDFVIACQVLRRARSGTGGAPGMVAGAHLRPLASAIGFDGARFIDADGSGEVPAAFDVRRRGLAAAVRSLVGLRRQLAELADHDRYVFDRIGWRERCLVPPERRAALPASANIYEAYAMALQNAGHVIDAAPNDSGAPIRSAVIVPASRLAAKTLPAATIGALARALRAGGVAAQVVLLEGDHAQVPSDVSSATIPRQFEALIECLEGFDLVVSADSLAAHLAELQGIRCFVVGPRPNSYWLPASCLRSDAWCLFDDVGRLTEWVEWAGSPSFSPP